MYAMLWKFKDYRISYRIIKVFIYLSIYLSVSRQNQRRPSGIHFFPEPYLPISIMSACHKKHST